MLSRFQGKLVRVTAEDGAVFTGVAETWPSGYGLHEFDRAEESLQVGDVLLFASDIRRIEPLSEEAPAADPRRFDGLMGELLEGPWQIVDILPEPVPREAGGQYFAVERYFLRPERLSPLRRKYADILLRLNCYYHMAVSFDNCETWEVNPEPEAFSARLAALSGNDFLRAVFESRHAMIDAEPTDTYMTVYDPEGRLTDLLRPLTEAEGLFLWPQREE